jgi:hypothetical protein
MERDTFGKTVVGDISVRLYCAAYRKYSFFPFEAVQPSICMKIRLNLFLRNLWKRKTSRVGQSVFAQVHTLGEEEKYREVIFFVVGT